VPDDQAACPALEEICPPGTCGGGGAECCFCGDGADGTTGWQVLYYDCEACTDGGIIDPDAAISEIAAAVD
jgi:hypothetical protein